MRKHQRHGLLFALVTLFFVAGFTSAVADDDLSIRFAGPRFFNGFIPAGADVTLDYTGLDLGTPAATKLFFKLGGGYEDKLLLRDTATGNPLSLAGGGEGISYDSPNFQWEAAFIQGLSTRPDGDNAFEVFLFYRGRYDIYDEELDNSVFVDDRGLFGTSIMVGTSYNTVVRDRHRLKSRFYAEAGAEWGPGVINSESDFWRISAKLIGYLPVMDVPTDGKNFFNMYLAVLASADLAGGDSVPIYVNQSFGGRDLRDSLGNCVRGYEKASYDSLFKAVGNIELRMLGPALGLESILPILYGFFDAGYYDGFYGSSDYADEAGLIMSTGGGIALGLFDFAQIGFVGGYKLVEDSLYGLDEPVFVSFKFMLHF
jgi:hypothetical protein